MKKIILLFLVFIGCGSLFAQGAGTAIQFDGTDDYVNIPTVLSGTETEITFEAWVYPDNFTGLKHIVYHSDNGEMALGLDGAKFLFSIKLADENWYQADYTISPIKQWYHIAGVWTKNDSVKLYINGIRKNAKSVPDKFAYDTGLSGCSNLGSYYNLDTRRDYMAGKIDEVRIWNIARTESQIREDMCKTISGATSNLLAYWRLDDGSGTTANDQTSNNHDGTLTNGSTWVNSGAAIGDASSYDYTGTNPVDFSATISHSNGDQLTATGDGGTVQGIQVYRVDATPNRTGATAPPGFTLYTDRYWGVFEVGTNPSYTVTYNYNGYSGISDESKLALVSRTDLSDDSWSDVAATLNTTAKTLTRSKRAGTEYALANKDATYHGAGHAISFDGTDDYIDCGNGKSLQITGALTLEAWVKLTANSSWDGIISKAIWDESSSGYVNTGYELKFNSSTNKVDFWLSQSGDEGTKMEVTANTALTLKWYHVAAVFSPSSFVKIYINGIEDVSVTSGVIASIYNSTRPLYIGVGAHNPATNNEYFHGSLDEVRIWNIALTADQIRESMCKRLSGNESGLVGYWDFSEGSGSVTYEKSGNSNDGNLSTGNPTWVNSGASVGDASAYDYTGSRASDFSATISHSDGDSFTATGDGGTVTGIQVYRIDDAPNVTTAPGNMTHLFTTRYWGVKIVGSGTPSYTATYYYHNNPDIGSYENYQDLAKRENNATASWTEANATLSTSAQTLVLTGQTGTQYIDGREDNPTPVELTTFTATTQNGIVILKWKTATEVNNYGFEIERRNVTQIACNLSNKWERLGFVEGHGNSNAPKEYSFKDENPPSGEIQYRLKQIDIDGSFTYSDVVEVENDIPTKFVLSQNYPNPFNPTTTISYAIPSVETRHALSVQLIVYDLLGRKVATLVNEKQTPGNYSVEFDASKLSSGIYYYTLRAGDFTATKKMILLR